MQYMSYVITAISFMILGVFIGTKPSFRAIVNDTLKEEGKWSMGRLSIFTVLESNLVFAAYIAVTTKTMPDCPPNWLILLVTLWGITKSAIAANAYITTKKAENSPVASTITVTGSDTTVAVSK